MSVPERGTVRRLVSPGRPDLDWILLRAIRMCLTGRVTWRGTSYGPGGDGGRDAPERICAAVGGGTPMKFQSDLILDLTRRVGSRIRPAPRWPSQPHRGPVARLPESSTSVGPAVATGGTERRYGWPLRDRSRGKRPGSRPMAAGPGWGGGGVTIARVQEAGVSRLTGDMGRGIFRESAAAASALNNGEPFWRSIRKLSRTASGVSFGFSAAAPRTSCLAASNPVSSPPSFETSCWVSSQANPP